MDAIKHLYEDFSISAFAHTPETFAYIQRIRTLVDSYSNRYLIGEVWDNLANISKYAGSSLCHQCFDFEFFSTIETAVNNEMPSIIYDHFTAIDSNYSQKSMNNALFAQP